MRNTRKNAKLEKYQILLLHIYYVTIKLRKYSKILIVANTE